MKNVTWKIWLKKVKNYYEAVRYLSKNKGKFEPDVDDGFYINLVNFNNIIMLASREFYVLYIEHYCKGKTLTKISEEVGYSRMQIHRIHKNFLDWLEKI